METRNFVIKQQTTYFSYRKQQQQRLYCLLFTHLNNNFQRYQCVCVCANRVSIYVLCCLALCIELIQLYAVLVSCRVAYTRFIIIYKLWSSRRMTVCAYLCVYPKFFVDEAVKESGIHIILPHNWATCLNYFCWVQRFQFDVPANHHVQHYIQRMRRGKTSGVHLRESEREREEMGYEAECAFG